MAVSKDLTSWFSGATLALCCWIVLEVHKLRVDLEVMHAQQVEIERRLTELEQARRRW